MTTNHGTYGVVQSVERVTYRGVRGRLTSYEVATVRGWTCACGQNGFTSRAFSGEDLSRKALGRWRTHVRRGCAVEVKHVTLLGVTLEEGARYRFVFQAPRQHYPRESVMTFLGLGGPTGREYLFSARPVAGTQTLDGNFLSDVALVERVSSDVPHTVNRVLRSLTPPVMRKS